MKKLICFLIMAFGLLTMCALSASAESMIVNPGDANYESMAKEAADKLFGKINFDSREELRDIKKLYDAGRYDDALSAYKSVWFKGFADKVEKNLFSYSDIMNNENTANSLLNNFTAIITDRSNISEELKFVPGSIDWGQFADISKKSDSSIFAEYTNMYFTANLAGCYMNGKDGNERYLDRWLDIWFDYDMYYNTKGNQVSLEEQEYTYSGNISCLKLERYNGTRFGVLAELYEYNSDELFDRMNNVQFAYMLIRALDRLEKVDLYIDSSNQSISGAQAAVALYTLLGDFDCAYDRMVLAIERFQYKQNQNMLKDGMDVEHDFKYNDNYVLNTLKIYDYLKACEIEPPKALNDLLQRCIYRLRSLLCTATHDDMHPNIADSYSNTPIETEAFAKYNSRISNDLLVNQLLSAIKGDGIFKEPAFGSVAFPYSGHYIMRENWSDTAQWMYFKGHRWSGGHSCDNNLSVMFFSGGERLLIDSGGNTYGSMDIGDYVVYSYAHNTVTVDGITQFWQHLDNVDVTDSHFMNTPLDGIWHSDSKFDFVTGKYTDGYSTDRNNYRNNVPMKEVNDVVHKRSVINDKENHIAVVYDRLDSSLAHTFNVNWNYAYKFNDYGTVFADSEDMSIKTALDDGKEGVDIYNFTQNDITYEVDCGEYGNSSYQDMSGWALPVFGVDYKPVVHVSTYFEGNCSQQGVLSLIVPKHNNENPLKKVETICDNQGFRIEKLDGTIITCVGGQRENTKISTGDFSLNAKQFYFVEKPDGTKWGMVYGSSQLTYKGKKYTFRYDNFEFSIKNDKVIYADTMYSPTDFEWVETDNGVVPYYGPDPDDAVRFRY